jgi:outer membrane protein assembly factor BamD (BamD/ComL family)
MYVERKFYRKLLLAILCFSFFQSHAQLGFSFDIKKPEMYEDRILGSEKSESKKYTLPRRLTQNAFTHYNYVFNANNKLNEVLERAKTAHIDDYTRLLPFYNYTLDQTAADSLELDSVISKAITGIVLHDLRNQWIDNLYLLQGAAYYLGKQFDSAYLTFQFINYAFAKKEKDGYYQTIGSKFDGNSALSISTEEKNSLPRKVFSEPPSRNDAFIWQIRTLIAMEEYAEAASLIITLKNDPEFPKRLKNDLEEVQAWWFYNSNVYDSAAVHLEQALSNATNKKERARWEFLIAQLYERSGKLELARKFYDKVINHTIDPVMEIYARLHSIRINQTGADNYIDRNIAELLKMAKRDKYYDYKDVIYYTIAQMELERNNFDAAMVNLKKSTENSLDPTLKNKAFLQMADMAFAQRKYREAKSLYDSINIGDPALKNTNSIVERKQALTDLVAQLDIAERQDSLQRIAAMPEEERKEYVKKLVRQLRKEKGLKEEPSSSVLVPIGTQQNQQTDLFSTNSAKGEWYFYNAALKTKGVAEFKAKWGNRPNVDNWRRSSGMSLQQTNRTVANQTNNLTQANAQTQSGEISLEALYENLPVTTEKLQLSNDSLSEALYKLGRSFANDLEDCNSSIEANEELAERFPSFNKMDEILFTLFYCYKKTGAAAKAEQVKKVMEQKFAGSRFTIIVTTGKDPGSNQNPDATKAYEDIYDLFIEGNFEKAVADKAAADAKYGSTYWTPQLMYIESVFYIKQKDDAKAIDILNAIIAQKPNTPMAAKAATMIDVLNRRQKIEDELRNLNVQRTLEKPLQVDTATKQAPVVITQLPQKEKEQQVVKKNEDNPVAKPVDTVANKPIISAYSFKAEDKYYAAVILTKVDMVWVNETKNAFNIYNRGKFYNKQFELSTVQLNPEYKLVLIGNFENAQAAADYVQSVKPVSNSQIVPWLAAEKYSFTIISASNLEILKARQDIGLYKQFIEKNMPGKF